MSIVLGIIYFLCNCKRDGFLSSPESSLFMYINATDFLIFILHPATLLNSVIRITSFLVESLRFSIYTILSLSRTHACLLRPHGRGLRRGSLDADGGSMCLTLLPRQQLLSFPRPCAPGLVGPIPSPWTFVLFPVPGYFISALTGSFENTSSKKCSSRAVR